MLTAEEVIIKQRALITHNILISVIPKPSHSMFRSKAIFYNRFILYSGHGPSFRSLAVVFGNNGTVSESLKVGYACALTINWRNC